MPPPSVNFQTFGSGRFVSRVVLQDENSAGSEKTGRLQHYAAECLRPHLRIRRIDEDEVEGPGHRFEGALARSGQDAYLSAHVERFDVLANGRERGASALDHDDLGGAA